MTRENSYQPRTSAEKAKRKAYRALYYQEHKEHTLKVNKARQELLKSGGHLTPDEKAALAAFISLKFTRKAPPGTYGDARTERGRKMYKRRELTETKKEDERLWHIRERKREAKEALTETIRHPFKNYKPPSAKAKREYV